MHVDKFSAGLHNILGMVHKNLEAAFEVVIELWLVFYLKLGYGVRALRHLNLVFVDASC
jgi:hypothetical protein